MLRWPVTVAPTRLSGPSILAPISSTLLKLAGCWSFVRRRFSPRVYAPVTRRASARARASDGGEREHLPQGDSAAYRLFGESRENVLVLPPTVRAAPSYR